MVGNRYLLDTNAIIASQKRNKELIALLEKSEAIFVPSIVIGELYFGAYKSEQAEANRGKVAALTSERVILSCDAMTAEIYGQLKYELRDKGRPIPDNNIWIAALAFQYDLTLLTQDQHFSEIERLKLLKW